MRLRKLFYLFPLATLSFLTLMGVSMRSRATQKQLPQGPQQLKGAALKAVFNDTLMIGEYRLYRDVTHTYNYTEFHHADGTTDYVEGKKKLDGRWKIIGDDKVCYKYPHSDYYNATYCFFVFKQGKCYYKFSLSQMTLHGPRDWNRWSSRAVRKGEGGSCGDQVS